MRKKVRNAFRKKDKRILREINYLLHLAYITESNNNNFLSRRMVEHALKLSQKTNVRIPREKKLFLCKKCGTILIPGKTAMIRLHRKGRRSYISIKCLNCGNIKRIPYKGQRNE
jgi:ribonuclease P protein subunit RPR2